MENEIKSLMESLWCNFENLIEGMTGDENNMTISFKNGKKITVENYSKKTLVEIIDEIEEKENE